MNRRSFVKLLGCAGGTALLSSAGTRAARSETEGRGYAILVDTTRCAGCRSCEYACAEAHGFPSPVEHAPEDASSRATTTERLCAVQERQTSRGEVYVRRQCMNCLAPACASACLTKAMVSTAEGPVTWEASKCMGCRYCMISCPFDMPRFEYEEVVPSIRKCDMCHERLTKGLVPACVESCPADALSFGRRDELLRMAWKRILDEPESYVPHVYGENEAGGTSWLYLAGVPFEELGLPTGVGDRPLPEYTKTFLTSVPLVLTIWPAVLLGLHRATHGSTEVDLDDQSSRAEEERS
jgi:Fe-S-cluster-containing dehydrogenase component